MRGIKTFFTVFLLYAVTSQVIAQKEPPFLKYIDNQWVDSVMSTLSTDQKIAQSLWVATWSNKDMSHYAEIEDLITNYGIGGLIFFQGTTTKQVELINRYQSISTVPLLTALDAEWGAGMRLEDVIDFPYQMTLGAISDDSLLYRMGEAVAYQLKRTGININFAPVADVNNNPANPVINYRSFGEDPLMVAKKSVMYMNGMQDHGIIATAKHFPGHGDTQSDSHFELPVLLHDYARFDSLELIPFRNMVSNGTGSVMTAHLNIPSLDSTPGIPSSLSKKIISGILHDSLGFRGLTVTDAINMKGVTGYSEPGVYYALAYEAGNDVLEYVEDIPLAIRSIREALSNGKITIDEIDNKCRKILAVKYWSGLNSFREIDREGLPGDLNSSQFKALIREMYSSSLTLLNNKGNIIPVKDIANKRIAILTVGSVSENRFSEMISNYVTIDHYTYMPGSGKVQEIITRLANYDLVIADIHNLDQRPQKKFGVTPDLPDLIEELNTVTKTIVVWFGNPYGIDLISPLVDAAGLLLTYQESDMAADAAAQLIMGGLGAHGRLPVSIGNKYPLGSGVLTPGGLRLQYGYPENAGIDSNSLNRKIDSLATLGIDSLAYPGCEVIIARNGIVVYHKTFGYHTYEGRTAVLPGDLYDLASVTKIAASTTALMVLDDMDLFSPDDRLGEYWDGAGNSDKSDLIMRDILAHQSGMQSYIQMYKLTLNRSGKFRHRTFKAIPEKRYNLEVGGGLYLNDRYLNKISRSIRKSPLGEPVYLYSGLTFLLVPQIVRDLSGVDFESFLKRNVYDRIGASRIVFNPAGKFPYTSIVPTENDTIFRQRLVFGYVHDENAAMLGGYSGNAGLFAGGNDLLKLLEMFRRGGNYGGEQVISSDIITEYTSYQFPENDNRRGLGFDKPQLDSQVTDLSKRYPCPGASPSGFGHSGFTGTFAWVDPANGISYVFLSNRVYPTRNNNMLSKLNIRTEILQAIIDSITG